jgi:FtsH-binding integral membrane protein
MDFIKIFWVLIPVGIYIFFTQASREHRETATAYFWVFVVGMGVFGILYAIVTTGSIPTPCCTE